MSLDEFWISQIHGPSSEEEFQSLPAEADNELSDSLSSGRSLLADVDANSTSTPGGHAGPSACPLRPRRNEPFKDAWRKEYLMYPNSSNPMQCTVCGAVLTSFKTSTMPRRTSS